MACSIPKRVRLPSKYARSSPATTVKASALSVQPSWTVAPPFCPGTESEARAVPPCAVADSSPTSSSSPSGLSIVV